MSEETLFICNGCRGIMSHRDGEPERKEVRLIASDTGEEKEQPLLLCHACQKKLAKGQALFPFD